MLGKASWELADETLLRGVDVISFSFPVVPKGKAPGFLAACTAEQIKLSIVWRALYIEVVSAEGVIPANPR